MNGDAKTDVISAPMNVLGTTPVLDQRQYSLDPVNQNFQHEHEHGHGHGYGLHSNALPGNSL